MRLFSRLYWKKWFLDQGLTEEVAEEWFKNPVWRCPECGDESESKRPLREGLPLVCIWFPKCPGVMIPKIEKGVIPCYLKPKSIITK